jgi:hypothetical protein
MHNSTVHSALALIYPGSATYRLAIALFLSLALALTLALTLTLALVYPTPNPNPSPNPNLIAIHPTEAWIRLSTPSDLHHGPKTTEARIRPAGPLILLT